MGLRTSPYQAVQGIMWALERILGDRNRDSNVFRWRHMRLNLPGSYDYNPELLWVSKVRADGSLAADVHVYVDDLRVTGQTEAECWRASQRVLSVLPPLGLQDAARKRRVPGMEAGAWAGSVVHTTKGEVVVKAPQDKWVKLQGQVDWLVGEVEKCKIGASKGIPYDDLERVRGFMVHMVRTYPSLNPYLKGVHLTLSSWLPDRDEDGWKIKRKAPKGRKRSRDGSVLEREFEVLEDYSFWRTASAV
jgi:hypothetical protein